MIWFLLSFSAALSNSADLPEKAPIVPESKALEEPGRYLSSRNFDETIKYYKLVFRRSGGVRFRNIVNLPGIKAIHIESQRRGTAWEGINVYERRGETRIFVVERPPEKAPAAQKRRSPA